MTELHKNKKRMATVWRFAKPYTFLFVIAELCMMGTYAVSVLLPLNLAMLTDKVLYLKNQELLNTVIRNYVILFFTSVFLNMLYAFFWQTIYNRYVVDVKNALYEKVIHSKARLLTNMSTGDIMTRIDSDADQFIQVIQKNLFHFINSIILCIGILFIVAKINGIMMWILLLSAMLPTCITKLNSKLTEQYSKKSRELTGNITSKLFEFLKGMRELRLLCAQWWAKKNIFPGLRKILYLTNNIRKMDFTINKVTHFINLLTSFLVYGFSAFLMLKGDFTIGLFMAIVEYVLLLHKKLNWVLRIYLDWHVRKVSIDRVTEILEWPSEDICGESIQDNQINCIEFQHIQFGYNETLVLRDVSFTIKKGERVAIIGASGVGKTTLTGLLLKMFTPLDGKILLNDQDIQKLNNEDVRHRIGVVHQEPLVLNATLRYNLTLGNTTYTDEDILSACEKSGLEDYLNQLPEGLDTEINEKQSMSGGQKKRLMIARILLKNSSVIVFDEATSELDAETEHFVLETLDKISKNATVIVISHRPSTIKFCEKIIVINQGRVECVGSHEDVSGASLFYRDFMVNGGIED